MTSFRIDHLPTNEEELYWLVRLMWGVSIPNQAICPDHISPMKAFSDAFFRRNSLEPLSDVQSIALWHGSRGLSGKSFALSILGLTITTLLGGDVNLLGGSLAQSTNIHEHMRAALEYENAPTYMVAENKATELKLYNRARVRPLTASQRTVRGPHPATLLLDEIDEMELAILDAALGQPMPQLTYRGERLLPYTVMCSTWQNPEGTFTEIMHRAETRHIPIYRWCYKETSAVPSGWLTPGDIEEKRQSIPAEMFRVEYDLGEPSIGNRAFTTTLVDQAFTDEFEPIFKKEDVFHQEYTFEKYTNGGIYVAGADWAKEQDFTVIWVARVDCYPRRLVHYVRINRQPYPVIIRRFNDAMKTYNIQHNGAWHDDTGLGHVVNDYLDIRARPFQMTGDKRAIMLSDYINAIEKGAWKLPKAVAKAYEEMKWCRVGDIYKTSGDYHLPDTVCAGALAEYAARRVAPMAIPEVPKRSDAPPTKLELEFTPEEKEPEKRQVTDPPTSRIDDPFYFDMIVR